MTGVVLAALTVALAVFVGALWSRARDLRRLRAAEADARAARAHARDVEARAAAA
ncbi:DUF1049 domain-containing protein, partial [Streptomyces triticirhizae]